MERHFTSRQIRQASGETLLLMTVFGSEAVRQAVNRELDRRGAERAGRVHGESQADVAFATRGVPCAA
jgi:hypothetical protein